MKTLLLFFALLFSNVPLMKSNEQSQAVLENKLLNMPESTLVSQNNVGVLNHSIIKEPLRASGNTYTLADNTFNAAYETSNFTFYYDYNYTSYSVVQDAASVYEDVRSAYINLGFRTPILENYQSKYRVGLIHDGDGALGRTRIINPNAKTSPTFIRHYYLDSGITDVFKETAAHEYMHAIQNAYNTKLGPWFHEALAGWGEFALWGKSTTTCYDIQNFINANTYLADPDYMYGEALFPLTFTRQFGGSNGVMTRILDGFSNMSGNYTEQKFIDIVNNALSQSGYTTYTQILNYMHAYMINPVQWYPMYGATNNWGKVTPSKTINISTSSLKNSTSGTLTKSSGQYIKFNIDPSLKGNLHFTISSSNGNIYSSKYATLISTGKDNVFPVGSGTVNGVFETYGRDYSDVGLVVTNPDYTNPVNYTITYYLTATNDQGTLQDSDRIISKTMYVPMGGYAEYRVSFAYRGYKIIQTAGTLDTKIAVYRSTDNYLLNNIDACDDKGCGLNSYVRILPAPNIEYIIRIYCYNSSNKGYTKLLITPDRSESYLVPAEFTDIFVDTEPFYLNDSVTDRAVRLQVFKPEVSREYTISLESEFDNYLYIFDMSSSDINVNGKDYDDDSGSGYNAKITRYLEKNKTYLIIFCQYNPSRSLDNVSSTIFLDIE